MFSICHATEGNNKVVAAILNKRPINFLSFETKLLTFKSFFQRDKELAERFFLKPASEYNYLNQSGCITLDGVDDVIKFDNLRLAFEVVQVPQNMVEGIFAPVIRFVAREPGFQGTLSRQAKANITSAPSLIY